MAKAKLKKAEEKATWTDELWFSHWHAFEACDDYNVEVGQVSHRLSEDEALSRLKVALADPCPSLDWNTVWSQYQEIYDKEAALIRAQMEANYAKAEAEAKDTHGDDDEKSQVLTASEADPEKVPPSS